MSLMETARLPTEDRWPSLVRAAGVLRAAFIDQHARGEAIVDKTLLALHHSAEFGPISNLPHLAGQRLVELRALIEARNTQFRHAANAINTLNAFQRFDRQRGLLCHGVMTVTVDQHNKWHTGFRTLTFRSNRVERDSTFMSQADMETLLAELSGVVKRLSCALGQIRASTAPVLAESTASAGCQS